MSFERFHRSPRNLGVFQTLGYIARFWTFIGSLKSERFVRSNIGYIIWFMTLTTRVFSKWTKKKLFQGRVYYTKTSDRISAQIIHRICTNNHSPVVTDVQKFVENINFWRRYFIHPNKPKWEWLCILKILGLKTPRIQRNL